VYVDGTAGGGGHAAAIAQRLTTGKLVAIDKDKAALEAAGKRLSPYPHAEVIRGDFRNMAPLLAAKGIAAVEGVLLDLGVSSQQLDDPRRGFSYRHEAALDMRMSGEGLSAREVVNTYSVEELTRILKDYGEEKFAFRIAGKIEQARSISPIETTTQLAELIKAAIPAAARREGGHPAKRSFQAIRMEVNGELESLRDGLEAAIELLSPGGRIAVITFHSLEDRLVKQTFARWCTGCTCPLEFPVCVCGKTPRAQLVNKKPITATAAELAVNNRSHSAKLRILEKI
jgi:16S rRNA (cytosine1402-N4)-methyltransferase